MIAPLTISELIKHLKSLLAEHGDLPVYYCDDGTWAVTKADVHFEEADPDGYEEYQTVERIEIS